MSEESPPAPTAAGLPVAPAAAGLLTPARLVMAVFFLHAFGLSNWWPRVPDLQARLAIGPGELSIAMLGMPLATVLAVPFAGTLIARFGPRRMLGLCLPLTTLGVALPGWAFDVASLFVALFLIGLVYPVVDIAMNVEADRIQRSGGRRIMSTCHGCWSVGSVAGGLSATGFAAADIRPGWHLVAVALGVLPFALAIPRALPEVRGSPQAARVSFTLPSRGILGLCFFLLGTLMVEVAARNWGAVYVTDVLKAGPAYAGITYSAFALAMALGRFTGDRLIDRFGPVAMARSCCLMAVAGLSLVVLAGSPLAVVVGFAAAGFGVALGFPLSVTAAAGRGDLPPAVNVAALQVIGVAAFLFTPPLIGGIAELAGLRIGMAVVLPMILASVILAGELRRKTRPAGPGEAS
jgi:MFS family permease